jgi:hypothetical protein
MNPGGIHGLKPFIGEPPDILVPRVPSARQRNFKENWIMGCDIHAYVEVQCDQDWLKVGPVFASWHYRPDCPLSDWNTPRTDHPIQWRDYTLFGILAGVRNRSGNQPIAEPRGLPPDVSPEVFRLAEEFGDDGHSHSSLLLSEILGWEDGFPQWQGDEWGKAIEIMKKLGEPDRVRMVFWFDN